MGGKNWVSRFPGIENRAYMANCSQGPLSVDVQQALADYMHGWLEKGNPWDEWMETVENASSAFALLIRAKKEEVCPTFTVSNALSEILSCYDFSKRNEIVISDSDFPSTTTVALAQERRGCTVRIVSNRNGKCALDDYEKSINDKTLMVILCEVTSYNGFKHDARAMAEIAHSKGAMLFVDSYQSAGNSVIDVKRSDADFLAAGTQKYLLGIPGSAYLYVRDDLIQTLEPSFTGWFSQRDPFKFGRTKTEYAPDANRFQSGTWSVASHYAANASIKIILEVGDRVVQDRITQLTGYLLERLNEHGLTPVNGFDDSERGAFVSIKVPNAHSVEEQLRKYRIHASARGDGIRFALHFFNTKEDIDKGLETLQKVLKN